MNVLEKICKQIAQKINLAENLHIAAIFENSESEEIIGWAVLDDNNNILKQYDEIDELFNDYYNVDEMYEKHRTDTFRVVCEIFCCDPKEVLRKMMMHRNEVMPKIIEAEKKSIEESNNNKFYYIENTVDEHNSDITAYCKTLDDAKERLKTCRDWYGGMGTGRIYEVKFGGDPTGKLVYEKE